MSYPGAKVHRVSRRKLGRGQYPPIAGTTVTAATTTPNVTLTFSTPVVARNVLGFSMTGLTVLSFAQPTPTTVAIVMSGTTTTGAYAFNGAAGGISAQNGGPISSISGTF